MDIIRLVSSTLYIHSFTGPADDYLSLVTVLTEVIPNRCNRLHFHEIVQHLYSLRASRIPRNFVYIPQSSQNPTILYQSAAPKPSDTQRIRLICQSKSSINQRHQQTSKTRSSKPSNSSVNTTHFHSKHIPVAWMRAQFGT